MLVSAARSNRVGRSDCWYRVDTTLSPFHYETLALNDESTKEVGDVLFVQKTKAAIDTGKMFYIQAYEGVIVTKSLIMRVSRW